MAKKPKTNLEGLELVLSTISAAELARQITERREKKGKPGISRAGVAKWRKNASPGVPIDYVQDVGDITLLTRDQISPEVFAIT